MTFMIYIIKIVTIKLMNYIINMENTHQSAVPTQIKSVDKCFLYDKYA